MLLLENLALSSVVFLRYSIYFELLLSIVIATELRYSKDWLKSSQCWLRQLSNSIFRLTEGMDIQLYIYLNLNLPPCLSSIRWALNCWSLHMFWVWKQLLWLYRSQWAINIVYNIFPYGLLALCIPLINLKTPRPTAATNCIDDISSEATIALRLSHEIWLPDPFVLRFYCPF